MKAAAARALLRLLLLLPLLLCAASCSLITDFNAGQYREDNEENCSDGLDNDGNGKTDCADNPCSHFDFCLEDGDARCTDGLDNDVDGKIDCKDSECCAHAKCYLEASCGESTDTACADGLDNNGNGLTDCADFSCDFPACCQRLSAVLTETFASGNTSCTPNPCPLETATCCQAQLPVCNAFSPTRWLSWGMPRPRIANERFTPNQPCTSCPVSGIASVSDIFLAPGMYMEFRYNLQGETGALLAVGLAERAVFPQSDNLCGDVTAAFPQLLGVSITDGKVQAVVGGAVQASTKSISTGDRVVMLEVTTDGNVAFSHHGAEFFKAPLKATSPYPRVRLLVQGHGGAAEVDNVVLGSRSGCSIPNQWTAGPTGPTAVLSPTLDTTAFDHTSVSSPSALFDGETYRMYYSGRSTTTNLTRIGLAISTDGQTWSRKGPGALTISGETSAVQETPHVIQLGDGTYLMAYRHLDSSGDPEISLATSTDGIAWTRILTAVATGAAGSWDEVDVTEPALVAHKAAADSSLTYYLWYSGQGKLTSSGTNNLLPALGLAKAPVTSDVKSLVFTKSAKNPVLKPTSGAHDDRGVTAPAVLLSGNAFHMWYEGHAWGGRTQINLARSEDGVRWVRYAGNPVLRADEDTYFGGGALRAPSVLDLWGTRRMLYGGRGPSARPAIGQVVNR